MAAALASKGGHQGEIGETLAGNYGPDWRNWPWGPRLAQMEVSSCAASSGESTLRRISSVLAPWQPLPGRSLWKKSRFSVENRVGLGKKSLLSVADQSLPQQQQCQSPLFTADADGTGGAKGAIGRSGQQLERNQQGHQSQLRLCQ